MYFLTIIILSPDLTLASFLPSYVRRLFLPGEPLRIHSLSSRRPFFLLTSASSLFLHKNKSPTRLSFLFHISILLLFFPFRYHTEMFVCLFIIIDTDQQHLPLVSMKYISILLSLNLPNCPCCRLIIFQFHDHGQFV